MKMVKKILLFTMLFITTITLIGCKNNKNDGGLLKSSLKESDLSIDDFEWETTQSKCYGNDCYTFKLINNSKYDIIGVQFSYKVKSDVSDSELSIFDDFMKKHDGYIEEEDSPRNVTLGGKKNVLVSKGEELTGINFTIGFNDMFWYDYPTENQFNLMEPKELQIGVVGKDKKLYIAYYNFDTKTWSFDQNKSDVDVWSNSDLAKKIESPNSKHNVIVTDEEDEFKFYAYGITKEEFKNYTEKMKSLGFIDNDPSSSSYDGETSDGYEVNLWYTEDTQVLTVDLEKE